MSFNRKNVKLIVDDLEQTLEDFAKKHNLEVEVNGSRFGDFEIKPRIVLKGTGAAAENKQKETLKFNAWRIGLDESKLGKPFTFRNDVYEITDIRPRSKKYPVIAKKVEGGGLYKFPVSAI